MSTNSLACCLFSGCLDTSCSAFDSNKHDEQYRIEASVVTIFTGPFGWRDSAPRGIAD